MYAPLALPLHTIAPLIESLVILHNFCIDNDDTRAAPITHTSLISLAQTGRCVREVGREEVELVESSNHGRPVSLLGDGHNVADAEH